LVRLIKSAKQGEDAGGCDIRAVPHALREFGALALHAVPLHGVFVPNEPEIAIAIERIGKAHFDWRDARRELRDALAVVPQFTDRDTIAAACNHVVTVSDEAYFYAGLTFGITFASIPSGV
jgi:hypothetical protein